MAFYKISDYFTGKGITDSVIYHLRYGLHGAGFSEYQGLMVTSVVFIFASIYLLFRILSLRPAFYSRNPLILILSLLFLTASLGFHPAPRDFQKILSNKAATARFEDYYRKPFIRQKHNDNKNLVFIYLEGGERTYLNEEILPGLINEIRELESQSTYFTNIREVGMWSTISGIVKSQCGIPLVTPSHGNSMWGMDKFLPSAVCLGDLLNEEGYHLSYMGGADLTFAGKGKFFKTHHFDEVLGEKELLPKLKDPKSRTGWGIMDESLFDLAYDRFSELSEKKEKFGLFLLTLDTHPPNGFPSSSCEGTHYKDGANPMLNAVACSDHLSGKFVRKIMNSPWSKNTLIVLVSDHLALRNSATDLLKRRRNLFMIIDPSQDKPREIRARGSTLDIGTTILSSLGYEGIIGLGRDLLSASSTEDINDIHKYIHAWKKPASKFWDFPRIRDSIGINMADKTIRIDERTFKYPILVELNNKFETTLKFQFSSFMENKRVIDHLLMLRRDRSFITVDRCSSLKRIDRSMGDEGACLMMGQGRTYSKKMKIKENLEFSVKTIREILETQGTEFGKFGNLHDGPVRWGT